MSFLKITDHNKRDEIVKEFLALKNKIKDNFRRERLGEIETQSDLAKFFTPVTETQIATTKEITEGLKPIKEGIESIPKAITFPAFPSIAMSKEELIKLGPIVTEALKKPFKKEGFDLSYGLYAKSTGDGKNSKFYIGDKPVLIEDNNIIVDGEKYEGTRGLWELILSKDPQNITDEDLNNYGRLMIKTNALHRNNDPKETHPKETRSKKWKYFLRDIWYNREKYTGSGVAVVIPSDPNALVERLDLLLASQDAGHTGVRNELVSICDELKRQGVISADAYKKINSLIKI